MTRNNDAGAALRRHQRDYEAAIGEWEEVLTWSNRHGDREQVDVATKKLESLRQRFAAATLSKLDYEDWFESQFNSPFAADPELVAQIENSILEDAKRPARERIESFFGNPNERTPRTVEIIEKLVQADQLLTEITISAEPVPGPRKLIQPNMDLDGSPRRIKKEIWRDRLKVQKRKRTEPSGSKVGDTTNKTKKERGVWAHPAPPPRPIYDGGNLLSRIRSRG